MSDRDRLAADLTDAVGAYLIPLHAEAWAATIAGGMADRLIALGWTRQREPGVYPTPTGIDVVVDVAESASWVEDEFPDEVAVAYLIAHATLDEDALREAIVDIEEEKIDPRFWTDDLPDDYEPPGLGCGDADAIIERYTLLASQHVKEPPNPAGHSHTIPHPRPAPLDEERLARALIAYSESIDPREPPPDGWEYGETVSVALIDHPTKLAAAIAKVYREDTDASK